MKFSTAASLLLATSTYASTESDIWQHTCDNSPDREKCLSDFTKPGVSWDGVKGSDPYGADAVANPTEPYGQGDLTYWTDMVQVALKTYKPYFNSVCDNDLCESSPHPGTNTRSYHSLDTIKARIAALPGCQEDGTCFRGNELGLLRLNTEFYPECKDEEYCGISLGITAETHKKVRPVLDHIFGDGSTDGRLDTTGNKWSRENLRKSAAGFLASKNTLDVKTDSGIWTAMVLHDTALGMSLSESEAAEFVAFQAKAVVITALPSVVASTFGGAVGVPDALAYKARMLVKYEEAIRKMIASGAIPSNLLAADDADGIMKLSWGLMDALIFAGGLSVPGVITAGIAALNTGLVPDDFDIDDPLDAPRLVFECIRNYPPVLGVPYIETSTGFRHAPLAGMGGYDTAASAYGANAENFEITPERDFNFYHSRSIDWADSAAPVDGKPWTNHICPGKSMSYNMILGFWEALGPNNWAADPDVPIERENGPVWWTSPKINRICEANTGQHVGAWKASRAGAKTVEGESCSWFSWCGDGLECNRKWWQYSGVCRLNNDVKFLYESCSNNGQCDNGVTEKLDVDLTCSSGRCQFADGIECSGEASMGSEDFYNDDEMRADGHNAGSTAGGWLVVGGGTIGAAAGLFMWRPDRNLKSANKHTKMEDGTL
jgi:hypothetical protein